MTVIISAKHAFDQDGVEERPSDLGPLEWTLASGSVELTAASSMPTGMQAELANLLQGQQGVADASDLASRAAITVRALLVGGAHGILRVSGSRTHMLLHLVCRGGTGIPVSPAAAQTETLGRLTDSFGSACRSPQRGHADHEAGSRGATRVTRLATHSFRLRRPVGLRPWVSDGGR
jgi:hypothetical protein